MANSFSVTLSGDQEVPPSGSAASGSGVAGVSGIRASLVLPGFAARRR